MQRKLRDKGWIGTEDIIKSGIIKSLALEIGSGPGYLGLEWLKNTERITLKGLDISADMISIAERNAKDYGFSERVEYVHGKGDKVPFDDEEFEPARKDCVVIPFWIDVPIKFVILGHIY